MLGGPAAIDEWLRAFGPPTTAPMPPWLRWPVGQHTRIGGRGRCAHQRNPKQRWFQAGFDRFQLQPKRWSRRCVVMAHGTIPTAGAALTKVVASKQHISHCPFRKKESQTVSAAGSKITYKIDLTFFADRIHIFI